MKYISSEKLDALSDNSRVFVNRNILNRTIALYEIGIEDLKYEEELKTLLNIWNETHELEKEKNRIEPFIVMTKKDIVKCFKNYSTFPLGTFAQE